MSDQRKSPRCRGAGVQLWRADRDGYSSLEQAAQRFFDRFQVSVLVNNREHTQDNLAAVLLIRGQWSAIYNSVLASNFGGRYG